MNPPRRNQGYGLPCAPIALRISTFRRQHAIGPYIVDFCSPALKLIIEVDGSQHLDQEDYDSERTAFLAAKGYRVLRFWNADVMNRINAVMGVILDEMDGSNG